MAREIEHGPSGYRRGCRCQTCRAGHADKARQWRAAVRRRQEVEQLDAQAREQALADLVEPADSSSAPGLLDDSLAPGPIEEAFAAEVAAIVGEPPWKATLGALGRANARIVDQVARHQRLDVLSGVQLRMMDILDRLRRVADGADGDRVPTSWTAGLGDAD